MRRLAQLFSLIVACSLAMPCRATVDDAHSFAMEAAMPYVAQGFIVREDYWNGEMKSGQKMMVKHQFFKGNEYAFWLGTANDGCKLEIQVLDEEGHPVQIAPKGDLAEKGIGPNFTSVRVNPSKTGTYSVIFSVTSRKEKSVFWALAYGYR